METKPRCVSFDYEIALLSAGGGHVLIYTEDNRLFGCGWNNKGQLGMGDQVDRNVFEEIPLELNPDERIDKLASGWDSSAFITNTNRLFVFGGNAFHQLGFLFSTKVNILKPQHVPLPDNEMPLQVELSVRQMVIRTAESIFVAGKSRAIEEIRKERSNTTEECNFVKYHTKEIVTQIASGQHHLIYSTGEGKINGVGQNKFHQSETLSVASEEKIVQIKCGWSHNACLLASGIVLLWGRNTYGQMGNGNVSESEAKPIQLNVPEKISEIHLGSEHGLAQSVSGNVYTWGWNEHGNCGNGSEVNVLVPVKIPLNNSPVIKSCSGAGFCFVVTKIN